MSKPGLHIRRVTPTCSTGAYTSGDQMGGLMTFTNILDIGRTGIVRSVVVLWESATPAALNLWLFNGSVTLASSDNAALNIADGQLKTYTLGHIHIPVTAETELATTSANGVVTAQDKGLVVNSEDANLYGVLEVIGTPTLTTAGDITVILGVEQV